MKTYRFIIMIQEMYNFKYFKQVNTIIVLSNRAIIRFNKKFLKDDNAAMLKEVVVDDFISHTA